MEKEKNKKQGYEKPVTKKHEAMNIVQGSTLYYSNKYSGTSLYYTYVKLYYYY